jgi:hypothetical protein
MGILDQITQMKSQGLTDQDVIHQLQQQGIPPKDIQDAMSEAQIKNAVIGAPIDDMQQSIMDQVPSPEEEQQEVFEEQYQPQQQTQSPEKYYQQPQETYYPQPQENYPPQENYQQQEYYPPETQGEYYPQESYSQGSDTNTLIEISEQVFSEKIKKLQKVIDSLTEFKTLTDTKLKSMEERLKRIETTIDQLQMSILDKIGSYGDNLNSIRKEMSMMQDSFGKIVNPFMDKYSRR